MFVPFELQSYFVYSQEALCFGEKLDLQTHADNLGSVHAGGRSMSISEGMESLTQAYCFVFNVK